VVPGAVLEAVKKRTFLSKTKKTSKLPYNVGPFPLKKLQTPLSVMHGLSSLTQNNRD
jgi:hypothetical protein